MPESNACQLVLKYLLMNRNDFVKAYHNRVYPYSSGDKFKLVVRSLDKWIDDKQAARAQWLEDPPAGENPTENPHIDPLRALKHVQDVDGLHIILGEVIIAFMKAKPQPYLSHALDSKDNFWNVPRFKRCMTFVYLIRYILGYKSQSQWKKFEESDLKLNTRCFRRWMEKDEEIFEKCPSFKELPDHAEPVQRKQQKTRKRNSETTSFSSDSPMKRRYVVPDDSTSEDE